MEKPREAIASVRIRSEQEEGLVLFEPEEMTSRREHSEDLVAAPFDPEPERQASGPVLAVREAFPRSPGMYERPESPSAVLVEEAKFHRGESGRLRCCSAKSFGERQARTRRRHGA